MPLQCWVAFSVPLSSKIAAIPLVIQVPFKAWQACELATAKILPAKVATSVFSCSANEQGDMKPTLFISR